MRKSRNASQAPHPSHGPRLLRSAFRATFRHPPTNRNSSRHRQSKSFRRLLASRRRALAALHLIEQNKLSLDQPIRFLPEDRILPHTYSPLQDKYPEAGVDIPLRELLRLSVSLSDNAAADIVLRTIGGPIALDNYIKAIGIAGFHIEDNEARLHRDVTRPPFNSSAG
jgi:hypothetical protein